MIASFTESRKDRLIHERIQDPKTTRKPAGSTVCPVCKAVFKDGHWQWLESWPLGSPREICQACQRIRDNDPAGLLTLTGDSLNAQWPEILNLVRHQEQGERARHPLNRIISIDEKPETVVVATTDLHLPKRIGQALHRAFKGKLDVQYDKQGCFVRVHWTADENRNQKKKQPIARKRR